MKNSGVPKRSRSKRGRTQKHANLIYVRKRAQMSAKERKTQVHKRAQKGASV